MIQINIMFLPVGTTSPHDGLGNLTEHVFGLILLRNDILDDTFDDTDLEIFKDSPLHHFALLSSHWN